MNPEPDLLGDEPVHLPREREPRPASAGAGSPRSRWLWALPLLVVAVTGLAVVDGVARTQEAAAVSRCQERLQLATGYAEQRLGLVTNYLAPTLSTNGRVQQLHLADLMSARASAVLPRVQSADRYCHSVRVRPWHFALVQRQGDATAYSAALVTLVQTIAAQGHTPFRADATLQRLREAVGVGG